MSGEKSSMNKDLEEWLLQNKKEIKKEKDKKKQSSKPKGMCQICGKKTAVAICAKCGKSVCKSCYFKLIGVCKKCVPKEIASRWDGSNPEWEKKLGVEWVE